MKSTKCYLAPLVEVNFFENTDVIRTSEYDGIITETGNWSIITKGGEEF